MYGRMCVYKCTPVYTYTHVDTYVYAGYIIFLKKLSLAKYYLRF